MCQYGKCNPQKDGYECQCKDGYKGKYCEGKKETLETLFWNNDASIPDLSIPWFSSIEYKILIIYSYFLLLGLDHCYGNKCEYGECNALPMGYQCKCKDGYKGKYCQGK